LQSAATYSSDPPAGGCPAGPCDPGHLPSAQFRWMATAAGAL